MDRCFDVGVDHGLGFPIDATLSLEHSIFDADTAICQL